MTFAQDDSWQLCTCAVPERDAVENQLIPPPFVSAPSQLLHTWPMYVTHRERKEVLVLSK